jgi:multidrug efflux pump subunit AcrA (membrane-fusion protein)
VTLVQLDLLRIRFHVPFAQAGRTRVGQEVAIHFPEADRKGTGRVETVAPTTDAKSGTVQVTVVLNNVDGLYRSGIRCLLQLPPEAREPGSSAHVARSPEGDR